LDLSETVAKMNVSRSAASYLIGVLTPSLTFCAKKKTTIKRCTIKTLGRNSEELKIKKIHRHLRTKSLKLAKFAHKKYFHG